MKSKILIAAVGAFGLLMAGNASACWTGNCGGYTPPPPPSCGDGGSPSSCIGNNPKGDYVWDFTSYSSGASTSGSWSFVSDPSGGPGVDASALENTNSASGTSSSSYGTGDLRQTTLTSWGSSGLGAGGESYPEHAVDNEHRIDSILLAFDTKVTLKQVAFGWVDNDYDFTLAAYTGSGDPTSGLSNLEYSELAGNGWGLIETHTDGESYTTASGTAEAIFDVNAGEVSSSYWLISAFNSKLDPGNSKYNGALDYFKLCAVSADKSSTPQPPSSVPEPSVVSLFLMGLLLAGYLRARSKPDEMMTLKA
jgi:hypothetical protein